MIVSACVCVCVTPKLTGGLQPDIPPTDHTPYWEMSRHSLYLRGFLLFCISGPFCQINTMSLWYIPWYKLWDSSQTQGHVPLSKLHVYAYKTFCFVWNELIWVTSSYSRYAFILSMNVVLFCFHPSFQNTCRTGAFIRVGVRFIIETWSKWWQLKIKCIDPDRKSFTLTISMLLLIANPLQMSK